MSCLLELQHINKEYTLLESRVVALNDVNLSVKKGERLAIIGTSGSGKSTLMNIIGLLDRQTSGRYFFDGKAVDSLNDHELAFLRGKKIGFVFQSFFLLPRLSAVENVMLPLLYQHYDRAEAKEKALQMLSTLQITKLAMHKPSELSGGQQQRIAIARALVGNPEIVLADEPTGALDSATGNEVMKILTDLNEAAGKTLIIITHDKEVSKQCKRIVSIKDGALLGET